MTDLEKKAQAIAEARSQLKSWIQTAGGLDMTADNIVEFNKRNDALETLVKSYKDAERVAEFQKRNDEELETLNQVQQRTPFSNTTGQPAEEREFRGVGDLFVETRAFKNFAGGQGPQAELKFSANEMRTVLANSAGFAPQLVRNRPVLLSAQRPIRILDTVPTRPTTQPAIKYMEETTFTNNAAETAESVQGTPGVYPESALQFTEKVSNVQKIAVYIPVTDEQLHDVEYIRSYVNDRLGFMLSQRLESQMVGGNGTTPNLLGLLNLTSPNTYARNAAAGEAETDAVMQAVNLIATTIYANADVMYLNPTNWMNIRLLKSNTGAYLFGRPDENAATNIFGVQPVTSVLLPLGTGIVQDTSFLELAPYTSINVQISNSHNDFFIQGKQAIRADVRVAFLSYRPKATCLVTGLR